MLADASQKFITCSYEHIHSSHLWINFLQFFQEVLGFRPGCVIKPDIGIKYRSIFADEVTGRHRQGPALVTVMSFEIDSEGKVNFSQFVRNGKDYSKLVGNDVVLIAENRDGEIVLFDDLASELRSRWRDCQKAGAKINN